MSAGRAVPLLGLAWACAPGPSPDSAQPASPRLDLALPPHFPALPGGAPTVAEAELGRHLFHDFRLSVNEGRSCGICHEGKKAYTDGFVRAVGTTGQSHSRNTLSLINIAWRGPLTWRDPSVLELDAQLEVPLFGEHPVEMGMDPAGLVDRLSGISLYPPLFAAAYPDASDPLSMAHIASALVAYERLIISGDSPYDRWLLGEEGALSAQAEAGRQLFFSPALGCSGCHGGLFLDLPTDADGQPTAEQPDYLNTGLYNIDGQGGYPPEETGLFALTGQPEDMGRFRVPSLRGVARSGPWGHDGSIGDLGDLLDAYARGGRLLVGGQYPGDGAQSPLKDPRIAGFALSAADKAALLAFLDALTDEEALSRPFLQTPFCSDPPDTADGACTPVAP